MDNTSVNIIELLDALRTMQSDTPSDNQNSMRLDIWSCGVYWAEVEDELRALELGEVGIWSAGAGQR